MEEYVRAAVLAYFLASGYPQHSIAAVDRYITGESGYDYLVRAWSGSCLFQWVGERRRRLMRGTNQCPPLDAQLRFADAEIRGIGCFWAASPGMAYAVFRRTFGQGQGC